MIRDELEGMYSCTCIDAYKNRDMVDPSCWGCEFKSAIPDILAITNPPLTVTIPCDKCGGTGGHTPDFVGDLASICDCTDGKVEREIEWEWDSSSGYNPFTIKPLESIHLTDIDMAETFVKLKRTYRAYVGAKAPLEWVIPNNKGTHLVRYAVTRQLYLIASARRIFQYALNAERRPWHRE
jgi:hypothetical protein